MKQFKDITDVEVLLNTGLKIHIGSSKYVLSKYLKHSNQIELNYNFSVDIQNTPQTHVIKRYKNTLYANILIKDIFRFIQRINLVIFEEINFLGIN